MLHCVIVIQCYIVVVNDTSPDPLTLDIIEILLYLFKMRLNCPYIIINGTIIEYTLFREIREWDYSRYRNLLILCFYFVLRHWAWPPWRTVPRSARALIRRVSTVTPSQMRMRPRAGRAAVHGRPVSVARHGAFTRMIINTIVKLARWLRRS